MVVFSNHRLGPSAELLLSPEVATEILRAVADAARPVAEARWEHELVRWLDERARATASIHDVPREPTRGGVSGPALPGQRGRESPLSIDVADIAWTPEHFERQREFLLAAIGAAAPGSEHERALGRWVRMIEAHPRDSVQVGRRWQWPASEVTA